MKQVHHTMKIAITSTNPVKKNAAMKAFQAVFPDTKIEIEVVEVASGVSDQPLSEVETLQGALQRVEKGVVAVPAMDFWVGIEEGVSLKNDAMEGYAWIVVRDKKGKIGKGRSGTFFLPAKIMKLVKEGRELSDADSEVFKRSNAKHTNGTVGILTKDIISRTDLFYQAVVFALIPFINTDLY